MAIYPIDPQSSSLCHLTPNVVVFTKKNELLKISPILVLANNFASIKSIPSLLIIR